MTDMYLREAQTPFFGMERFAIKIDKNLRANLYKICRLCGIDNPEKVKVRDDEAIVNLEDGEPELWKKVLDCIGLLITKDDKMPQFMCTLCVDKINDFFEFREMCYATDAQTRKLLGIKEEAKIKAPVKSSPSSSSCKTEEPEIKQPVPLVTPLRTGRKRRNADMEICKASKDIKTDEADDVKLETADTSSSGPKKKRLKLETQEKDVKPNAKPGSASKLATKVEPISRLGLAKKRLKVEPVAKDKKDTKPAKITKVLKKNLKMEQPALAAREEGKSLSLQLQRKKKALELLKQRNLAKKVAVVKVEKLRKGSVEAKIKEEEPVIAPSPAPTQPKVKLKDKCAICSESFVNKSLLDKHIKSIHIPTIARYHCVYCNETLKKNMEIKNHNLWHKLSKTPFKCGYCSESSCSIYTYSKHIRDCGQVAYLDTQIPDWHCPECSEVFQTTYLFNIHSCVSNTLVCPGCDRSHKWKEDYFKHIPICAAAVHRIPSYMSTNIQVKNEAEQPASPIPLHNVQPLPSPTCTTVQPIPASRITPPLMDSNQCVVIPGNVGLLDEGSPPSAKSGSKKGKRITKKDLKRFDKLLKSTMTTLVSIKHEPAQGEPADENNVSTLPDVRAGSASPAESHGDVDDDFHHNDDDDSADEETFVQPVGTIKQEIIDEGYRDLYNNIEVNIKREVVLNRNIETPTSKQKENQPEKELPAPKPVLKLKITKEHGTLNSVLLDSPKSEKKKKKKKRKEEKIKASDKPETDAPPELTNDVTNLCALSGTEVTNIASMVGETLEEEPAMPLPGIVHIKRERTYSNDEEVPETPSNQTSHVTPSIVAATSGALQISCVSEGVHFNGPEEIVENEREEEGDRVSNTSAIQQEIDVKPRLEDLVPMLRIASVSSGEDLIKQPVKPNLPRNRRQIKPPMKAHADTPQIVSVASGSEAVPYQPETEKQPQGEETAYEKVDNNENVFDFAQIRIKEEIVDPTYGDEEDCQMALREPVDQDELPNDAEDEEMVDTDEGKIEEEATSITTEKQAEEIAYIANIDFNNLNIKQEKEYIDDGLDNAGGFDDDDSSDSNSESSSDAEGSDSESDREYRDLPSDEEEKVFSVPALAPLGLQISSVHSEFSSHEKGENAASGVQTGFQQEIKSNPTTECRSLEATTSNQEAVENSSIELTLEPLITTTVESKEEEAPGVFTADIPMKLDIVLTEPKIKPSQNYCPNVEVKYIARDTIPSFNKMGELKSKTLRDIDEVLNVPESLGNLPDVCETSTVPKDQVSSLNLELSILHAEQKVLNNKSLSLNCDTAESADRGLTLTSGEMAQTSFAEAIGNTLTSVEKINMLGLAEANHGMGDIAPNTTAEASAVLTHDTETICSDFVRAKEKNTLSPEGVSCGLIDIAATAEASAALPHDVKACRNTLPCVEEIKPLSSVPIHESEATENTLKSLEEINVTSLAVADRDLDRFAPTTTEVGVVPIHEAKTMGSTSTCVQKINIMSNTEETPTHESESIGSSVVADRRQDGFAPTNTTEARAVPTDEEEDFGSTSSPTEAAPTHDSEPIGIPLNHAEDINMLRHSEADCGLDCFATTRTAEASAAPTLEAKTVGSTSTCVEEINIMSPSEKVPTHDSEPIGNTSMAVEDVSFLRYAETDRDLNSFASTTTVEANAVSAHEAKVADNTLTCVEEINIHSPAKTVPTHESEPVENALKGMENKNMLSAPKADLSSIAPKQSAVQTNETGTTSMGCAANTGVSNYVDILGNQASPHVRVDNIMNDIDPVVDEINRFISEATAPRLLQDQNDVRNSETEPFMLSFSPRTPPSSVDQLTSTISQVIENLSADNDQPTLSSLPDNDVPETRKSTSVQDDVSHRLPSTSSSPTGNHGSVDYSFNSTTHSGDTATAINNFQPADPLSAESLRDAVLTNTLAETSRSISNDSLLESNLSSSVLLETGGSQTNATPVQHSISEIGISIDLSHVFSHSTLPVPVAAISSNLNEYNTSSQAINETAISTSTFSTDPERSNALNYMNVNLVEFCSSTSSPQPNFTEFQLDLNLPTAGQLHTQITPTVVHTHSTTSSNYAASDANLSEEVQNLLNEGTDATNTFELSDNILQASCSISANVYAPSSPAVVPVPNFTDLENVNEIAENNNNANIERELQDELGNVLAAAIADRSPNAEADSENLMNENRANLDTAEA